MPLICILFFEDLVGVEIAGCCATQPLFKVILGTWTIWVSISLAFPRANLFLFFSNARSAKVQVQVLCPGPCSRPRCSSASYKLLATCSRFFPSLFSSSSISISSLYWSQSTSFTFLQCPKRFLRYPCILWEEFSDIAFPWALPGIWLQALVIFFFFLKVVLFLVINSDAPSWFMMNP